VLPLGRLGQGGKNQRQDQQDRRASNHWQHQEILGIYRQI
jgi:hypothetical protein